MSPAATGTRNYPGMTTDQLTVTSAGTAEALNGGDSLEIGKDVGVLVKALPGNSGNVYVGDSTVDSSTGVVFAAGEGAVWFVDDASVIHVDVDNGGEGVSWGVET